MELKIQNVESLGKPLGQYSHITRVKASEFLFIAGMLAPGETFDAQCAGVFSQIAAALKSADADWGQCGDFGSHNLPRDRPRAPPSGSQARWSAGPYE
jgi:hypothetical protein